MSKTADTTKWSNPGNRRIAVTRAKDRANAVKWDLDTAVFLFGIAAIIVILGIEQVSIRVVAPVAIFGLAMVWLVGWRRARQAFSGFLEEELARLPDNWKDYYTILRINPNTDIEVINQAWERIRRIYREELPGEQAGLPLYSMRMEEVNEAYEVLSNPWLRTDYNRIYLLNTNTSEIGLDDSARNELIDLSQSISEEVSAARPGISWRIALFDRIPWRIVGITAISLLVIFIAGTSFAFARPEQALAAPFKGTAVVLTKASAGTVELISSIRGITAAFERKTVSTQLQAMRLDEDLKSISPVTAPTNDMAVFPSAEHPLFPEYLEQRFSQFRYTVDNFGVVTADTSWATTDAFLDKLNSMLDRLEGTP